MNIFWGILTVFAVIDLFFAGLYILGVLGFVVVVTLARSLMLFDSVLLKLGYRSKRMSQT